jgi:cobalt-zinc-cadmium efflux system outer membrane protein
MPRSLDTPLAPGPSLDSLLAASPAVLRAEAEMTRARAASAVVQSEFRPRIAATVGAQRFVEDGISTVGPLLGFAVTLPFTANRARRTARAADERRIALAETGLSFVRAQVRAALAAAHTRYESARERLAVYDAALLRGAREERESALAAYRDGELSLLELLDFERAIAHADIERVRARAEAVAAYADLILAATGDIGMQENR